MIKDVAIHQEGEAHDSLRLRCDKWCSRLLCRWRLRLSDGGGQAAYWISGRYWYPMPSTGQAAYYITDKYIYPMSGGSPVFYVADMQSLTIVNLASLTLQESRLLPAIVAAQFEFE